MLKKILFLCFAILSCGVAFSASAESEIIRKGIVFLTESQNADGSWSDAERKLVDSTEICNAFLMHPSCTNQLAKAAAFLVEIPETDTEKLCHKLSILYYTAEGTSELVEKLVSRQNADGGWGLGSNHQSDPHDSILALNTLALAANVQTNVFINGMNFLIQSQLPNGSWAFADESSPSDIARAALGMIALKKLENLGLGSTELTAAIGKSISFIDSRKQGATFGSMLDTALCYRALLHVRAINHMSDTFEYFKSSQSSNGSWNNDFYITALVLQSMKIVENTPGLDQAPDLLVVPAGIEFSPSGGTAGVTIQITATVFNIGIKNAQNSTVHLYSGNPLISGTLIGSRENLNIPAGSSARVQVSFETAGLISKPDIHVYADPSNTIQESDEINNLAFKQLPLTIHPDLCIAENDISFSSANPVAFQPLEMIAKIRNAGGEWNAPFTVELFNDTSRISNVTFSSIRARGTNTAVFLLALPQGTHQLEIKIDPDSLIQETDRLNNQAAKVLQVQAPPASPADLAFESIVVSPATPLANEPVTFTLNVINSGGTDITTPFTIVLKANNQVLHSYSANGMRSGELLGLEMPTSFEAGTWTIEAILDPESTVTESTRNNNQRSINLTVSSVPVPPDLTFAKFEISPSIALENAPVQLVAQLENRGTINASNVVVQFFEDQNPLGDEIEIPVVPGNGKANFQLTTSLSAGLRHLSVHVDDANVVEESDEANNISALSVLVASGTGAPDLAVSSSSINFSQTSPEAFEPVEITARISNIGSNVAQNVVVRFIDGANKLADLRLDSIQAGQTGTATVRTSLDVGTHELFVSVDPDYLITSETNRVNNVASASIVVRAPAISPPDILVESFSVLPSPATTDDLVKFEVNVINRGGASTTNAFIVNLIGNSQILHAFNIEPLPAGSRARLIYSTPLNIGNWTFEILADAADSVSESNESNNASTIQMEVLTGSTPPDLAAIRFEISPETVTAGDLVQLTAEVKNLGTTPANNAAVAFFEGENQLGNPFIIPQVRGGEIVQVQLTTAFSAGTRVLQVKSDPQNRILEALENNNAMSAVLNVGQADKPDIAVSSSDITFSDNTPLPGSNVQISARIQNIGTQPTGPFKVKFTNGDPAGGNAILIEVVDCQGLAPAQAQVITTTLHNVPSGTHRIFVMADSQEVVLEASELNNLASRYFSTGSLADITIRPENITFSHTFLGMDDIVTVYAKFDNVGGSALQNVPVGLYEHSFGNFDDISEGVIPYIPAGGSAVVELEWFPLYEGIYEIAAVANDDFALPESDYRNNFAVAEVEIFINTMNVTFYKVVSGARIPATEFSPFEMVQIEVTNPFSNVVTNSYPMIMISNEFDETHTVNPGGTNRFNFQVLNRRAGTYNATGEIRQPLAYGLHMPLISGSAPFTILPGKKILAVEAYTEPERFQKGPFTLPIYIQLTNGSNVDSQANIQYTILAPSGALFHQGSISVPIPFSKTLNAFELPPLEASFDEIGVYQIHVNASLQGGNTVSGSGTFHVEGPMKLEIEKTVTPATVPLYEPGRAKVNIKIQRSDSP